MVYLKIFIFPRIRLFFFNCLWTKLMSHIICMLGWFYPIPSHLLHSSRQAPVFDIDGLANILIATSEISSFFFHQHIQRFPLIPIFKTRND
jgi:hypothetical protein